MSPSVQRIPTRRLNDRTPVSTPVAPTTGGRGQVPRPGGATVTDIRRGQNHQNHPKATEPAPQPRPAGDPFHKGSPSRELLDTLSDKWTVLILLSLEEHALRHGEIKNRVEGISPKMLNQRLGVLVDGGLVLRTSYPVIPLRVEYGLTELGASVIEPVKALYSWTVDNVDEVEAHRCG